MGALPPASPCCASVGTRKLGSADAQLWREHLCACCLTLRRPLIVCVRRACHAQGRPERGLTLEWQLKERIRTLIAQENIRVRGQVCWGAPCM